MAGPNRRRSGGKKAMMLQAMSREPAKKGGRALPFGQAQPSGAANVKAPPGGKGHPPKGPHGHRALAHASIRKQAIKTPDPGRGLATIPKPSAAPKKKKPATK